MEKTFLKFEDLAVGMKIKDTDGDIGVVKECSDPHNVFIEYDGGGSALLCLDENCHEYRKEFLVNVSKNQTPISK